MYKQILLQFTEIFASGARDKYYKTEAGKTARRPEGEKQAVTNVSKLDETRKRAKIASPNAAPLAKKERKGENSSTPRGRGRGAVASQGKGRGRGQIKSAGRGLLPKPVEKGKGLLPPPPLMSLPVHKPTRKHMCFLGSADQVVVNIFL